MAHAKATVILYSISEPIGETLKEKYMSTKNIISYDYVFKYFFALNIFYSGNITKFK